MRLIVGLGSADKIYASNRRNVDSERRNYVARLDYVDPTIGRTQ